MITDLGLENEPEGVKAYYEGCASMADIAKKAAAMPGDRFRMSEAGGAQIPTVRDKSVEDAWQFSEK